ncbi:MAG TPA: lysophospholipid acyltransferase family protein [Alphaproteobacteria bacterium]|nr:lysophospholipid acyltransferase family protein [Alphaproteobacteria bacterium]
MASPLRALVRILAYLSLTFALVLPQAIAVALESPFRQRIPLFYHRTCRRIFGLRVELRGTMARTPPVLFASNHTSYLDIMVLASLIPGSFVAKSEVASWPLFGLLAKLQRTVFVVRDRRHAMAQRDEMSVRLAAGDDLILFPEGTSNDGNRVLPFKSALFAAAQPEVGGRALTVQPVSVAYTALDGMPLGRFLRPFYAWYGDMDMASHIWRVAGLGNATVVVEFHPPAPPETLRSRKALAEYCQRAVAAGVARALSGRPLEVVPADGEGAEGEAEIRTLAVAP